MRTQGEAHRDIVFDDFFSQRHLGQVCQRLKDAFAVHVPREQRQRFFRRDGGGGPERLAPRDVEGGKRVRFSEDAKLSGWDACAAPDVFDREVAVAARGGDPCGFFFAHGFDLAEAQTEREASGAVIFHDVVPGRGVDIDGEDLDAVFMCVSDDLSRCVKAHGLGV